MKKLTRGDLVYHKKFGRGVVLGRSSLLLNSPFIHFEGNKNGRYILRDKLFVRGDKVIFDNYCNTPYNHYTKEVGTFYEPVLHNPNNCSKFTVMYHGKIKYVKRVSHVVLGSYYDEAVLVSRETFDNIRKALEIEPLAVCTRKVNPIEEAFAMSRLTMFVDRRTHELNHSYKYRRSSDVTQSDRRKSQLTYFGKPKRSTDDPYDQDVSDSKHDERLSAVEEAVVNLIDNQDKQMKLPFKGQQYERMCGSLASIAKILVKEGYLVE